MTGGPIATKQPQDVLTERPAGKSNNCPGQSTAVEDLRDYEVEPGEEEPFDEGRAMLQIVHDMAPSAELAFDSAFNGELAFAEGIENLAKPVGEGGAGAQVIVDDVGYFEEPFFQDGPVAAAVNKVTEDGATYLSAAGNDNLFDAEGNEIASWEAPEYRDSGACPPAVAAFAGLNASHCMDFNPGAATDRTFGIKVEPEEVLSVDLQWAEPWEGVADRPRRAPARRRRGSDLPPRSKNNVTDTQEPVEILQWENEGEAEQTVQLVINRFEGDRRPAAQVHLPAERRRGQRHRVPQIRWRRRGRTERSTGTPAPPARSRSAAVPFDDSGEPEPYSSRGPVTHYFGPVEGTGPAPQLLTPEELSKPEVAATDCGATTFFARQPKSEPGVWRFCGTSAAAPHAAGVAALMLEDEPGASPEEVREALAVSAAAVGSFGPCAVGGGLIEAVGALKAIEGTAFPAAGTCEPPDASGAVFVAPGNWGSEAAADQTGAAADSPAAGPADAAARTARSVHLFRQASAGHGKDQRQQCPARLPLPLRPGRRDLPLQGRQGGIRLLRAEAGPPLLERTSHRQGQVARRQRAGRPDPGHLQLPCRRRLIRRLGAHL